MHLKNLDLNLLLVFKTLMEELQVTSAAKKLGLSQSAFSHALNRLRESLGDPLFVRTPSGMQPTARSERLYEGVKKALADLEAVLGGEAHFEPKTCSEIIRISVDDYLGQTIGVDIVRALLNEAPNLKIHILPIRNLVPLDAFRKGELDFAIRVGVKEAPGIYRKKIHSEGFVCLTDQNHPKIKRSLTLKQFTEHKHLLVAPLGGFSGLVDDTLEKRGLSREVQIATAHFSLAPWLLLKSDYILTLPESIAKRFTSYLPLATHKPPIDISPFHVDLLWHERQHNEPLSIWIRKVIQTALS